MPLQLPEVLQAKINNLRAVEAKANEVIKAGKDQAVESRSVIYAKHIKDLLAFLGDTQRYRQGVGMENWESQVSYEQIQECEQYLVSNESDKGVVDELKSVVGLIKSHQEQLKRAIQWNKRDEIAVLRQAGVEIFGLPLFTEFARIVDIAKRIDWKHAFERVTHGMRPIHRAKMVAGINWSELVKAGWTDAKVYQQLAVLVSDMPRHYLSRLFILPKENPVSQSSNDAIQSGIACKSFFTTHQYNAEKLSQLRLMDPNNWIHRNRIPAENLTPARKYLTVGLSLAKLGVSGSELFFKEVSAAERLSFYRANLKNPGSEVLDIIDESPEMLACLLHGFSATQGRDFFSLEKAQDGPDNKISLAAYVAKNSPRAWRQIPDFLAGEAAKISFMSKEFASGDGLCLHLVAKNYQCAEYLLGGMSPAVKLGVMAAKERGGHNLLVWFAKHWLRGEDLLYHLLHNLPSGEIVKAISRQLEGGVTAVCEAEACNLPLMLRFLSEEDKVTMLIGWARLPRLIEAHSEFLPAMMRGLSVEALLAVTYQHKVSLFQLFGYPAEMTSADFFGYFAVEEEASVSVFELDKVGPGAERFYQVSLEVRVFMLMECLINKKTLFRHAVIGAPAAILPRLFRGFGSEQYQAILSRTVTRGLSPLELLFAHVAVPTFQFFIRGLGPQAMVALFKDCSHFMVIVLDLYKDSDKQKNIKKKIAVILESLKLHSKDVLESFLDLARSDHFSMASLISQMTGMSVEFVREFNSIDEIVRLLNSTSNRKASIAAISALTTTAGDDGSGNSSRVVVAASVGGATHSGV